MNEQFEKLQKCYKSVKEKISFEPKIGLILGSGLGDYADQIDIVETLNYSDIEGFPSSTVVTSSWEPATIKSGIVNLSNWFLKSAFATA